MGNIFRHPPLACFCSEAEGQRETVELKPDSDCLCAAGRSGVIWPRRRGRTAPKSMRTSPSANWGEETTTVLSMNQYNGMRRIEALVWSCEEFQQRVLVVKLLLPVIAFNMTYILDVEKERWLFYFLERTSIAHSEKENDPFLIDGDKWDCWRGCGPTGDFAHVFVTLTDEEW